MDKIINIYYSNHGKLDGIEDFITILRSIFVKRGYKVDISDMLDRKSANLIIDEFTNVICNEEIAEFKKQYPNAKLYYVLTEFIEDKLLVRSFNYYGGLMDAAPLAALNIYFRKRRKDFNPPKLKDWLAAVVYFPLMPVYVLMHQIINIYRKEKKGLSQRLHSLAYMKMRYLGLENMIQYADGVILSHGMIEGGLWEFDTDVWVIGTIHPEIDRDAYDSFREALFKDKALNIEITGSITPFRRRYIDRINKYILLCGLNHVFDSCRAISFSSTSGGMRAAYSLHPPQTRRWKYASPTRIYRAIVYDHNVPVLTKVFNQHPIEELCLVFKDERSLIDMYRFYKDPEQFINFFKPRLMGYMGVAKMENDKIVSRLAEGNRADKAKENDDKI